MAARTPYHHGGLRDALIEAGLDLARAGGPDALTLREATRRVGVSPNAAYRHFADRRALLQAVGDEVLLRMAAQMEAGMAGLPSPRSVRGARGRLRAVGLGYIAFARAEPGWFDLAFFGDDDEAARDPAQTPQAPPFRLLVGALEAYVAAGGLAQHRRAGAEWACWAAVHGFAGLAIHGPLRAAPPERVDALAIRTVEAIIAGLGVSSVTPTAAG